MSYLYIYILNIYIIHICKVVYTYDLPCFLQDLNKQSKLEWQARRSSRMGGKVSSNSSMVFPWWSVRILMSWSHSCKGKTMGSTRMAYGFPYPKSIWGKFCRSSKFQTSTKRVTQKNWFLSDLDLTHISNLRKSLSKPDLKVILDGISFDHRVFDQLRSLYCAQIGIYIILRFYNVHLIRINMRKLHV